MLWVFSVPLLRSVGGGSGEARREIVSMIRHTFTTVFAVALALLLLIPNSPATAKGPAQTHTPSPTSVERRQIMDALRAPITKALKQKIVFEVSRLSVLNGWAFLSGVPRQPSGKPVDYSRTSYADAKKQGMFDDGVVALLKRTPKGKWTVVTYVLGPTDVPYVDWDRRYHAPRAIFGLPAGAR